MPLRAGDPIRIVTTKWGDRPHWEFPGRYLGSDAHGTWVGFPTGTHMARPGAEFVTETDQVGLVPYADAGGGGWWLATFHAPGYVVSTYVDMTTLPVWDGAVVRAVDLDLDVIRTAEGDVYVDDEDEFADHRVRHAYPAEVVSGAEASCAWVRSAVRAEQAPFDGASSAPWFSALTGLGSASP